MKIVVIAVGRIKERELRAVADDYWSRLRHYARCEEIELKDAALLRKSVPPDAVLVALEVDGEQLTSRQLASRVERWGAQGKGVLAFLIGGAEGIPEDLSRAAHARLSLSTLTLPHRLARVVLLEQLYRSMTLIRGEPYAREE